MSENAGILLPRDQTCNGCQHLNFKGKTCRNKANCVRANKQTSELILNTYTNEEGYIAIVRPENCKSYLPHEKKTKTKSGQGEE